MSDLGWKKTDLIRNAQLATDFTTLPIDPVALYETYAAYPAKLAWLKYVRPYARRKPQEIGHVMYPSSIGNCPRSLYLKLQGANQRQPDGNTEMRFLMGNLFEIAFLGRAIVAGLKTGRYTISATQNKMVLPVKGESGESVNLNCRTDAFIGWTQNDSWKNFILEMKRTRERPFMDVVRNGPSNKFGYSDQVLTYMLGCRANGIPVDGVYLVTASDAGFCEHFAEPTEDQLKEAEAKARGLLDTLVAGQKGTEVPRPEWATVSERPRVKNPDGSKGAKELDDVRCKYCDVNEACWPGLYRAKTKNETTWRFPV